MEITVQIPFGLLLFELLLWVGIVFALYSLVRWYMNKDKICASIAFNGSTIIAIIPAGGSEKALFEGEPVAIMRKTLYGKLKFELFTNCKRSDGAKPIFDLKKGDSVKLWNGKQTIVLTFNGFFKKGEIK
jgi:hypothetical protein